MKQAISWLTAVIVGVSCLPPASAQKRDDKAKQKEAASLQQQVDELKAGQQQILKELQEIRKILQSFQEAASPQPPSEIALPVAGEPFKGSAAARVAIVEYSDFQCPYCGEYAREIFPRLDSDYIKSGKVRYYFRDLPVPSHTLALGAAQAARCAGEQGKFWEMHDRLFANQTTLAPPDLTRLAHESGLDESKFSECLASGRYRDNIRRSMAGAERMGINGTPAFLLGVLDPSGNSVRSTKIILGAESFETFKSALDELLASPQK
ncbi:MAG: DsbA family protein [Blastocatellia bacterium]